MYSPAAVDHRNRLARSRPRATTAWRSLSVHPMTFSIAAAMLSLDIGSTSLAALPTISGRHDEFEAITGVPASIASNTGRPKPSSNDGYTNATAPAYARARFASVTYPKTVTPGWLNSSG